MIFPIARSAFTFRCAKELLQNQGVVHGGAMASLIDTASAFAVLSQIALHEESDHHRSDDSFTCGPSPQVA